MPPPTWAPPAGADSPGPGIDPPVAAPGATGHVTAQIDDSFSDFYRNAWPKVARGLAVTLGDRDLAAEATDEAMARAYQRWRTIAHYDQPAGWVYRVGLNWARSYHRRAIRRLPFTRTDHVEAPTVEDPSIAAALAALDVKHRSVVVCRLLLDWSVDETADALDIRPGTVKSRLHRALTQLQSSLAHLR
ncbi:MAG: sigma factor-like helix-turn-helix DNA-binding protein [Actinomycetota bacterium]|nr:sigma factor-like helix-turn-helix DNA-binding protein [Actinomycetota bacterium]